MGIAFAAAIAIVAFIVAAAVALPLRRTSPRLYGALLASFPVLALALYQLLGAPAALDRAARTAIASDGTPLAPETLAEAVAQLRAELERDPGQPEGWALLARSLAVQGDFPGARDAFAKALALVPDDPGLLVEAAQSRAQADPGNRFDDASVDMLGRALAIQPEHQRARWFLGISQRQRGLDAEAAATWETLLPDVDAATAASLRAQIDAARSAAGLPALAADPSASPAVDADATGLRIRVSLDPGFAARARLDGDASVFVIARIPGGPPMPVAVEKRALRELPFEVVLDDGDSPMPTQKLSTLQEVEVLARLSASGDAARRDGDVESAPVRVALPAESTVELVIGDDAP